MRYDVEVVTKLIVYGGKAVLMVVHLIAGINMSQELLGWLLK